MNQPSGAPITPSDPSRHSGVEDGRISPDDRELRHALDAAGIPVGSFDAEGHATSANAAFAELFGRSGDTVIGSHLMSLCDNQFSAQALAALVRVVGRVSETEVVDIATPTPSGQRFIRLTFAASSLPDGRLGKVICIGAELESAQSDKRTVLGGRRHRGTLQTVPNAVGGADCDSVEPDQPDAAEPMDYDIRSILGVVIAASSRNNYPFSLLRCNIEGLVGLEDSHGSHVTQTLEAVCEARLNQRLRPSDRVIRGERGTFLVIAEHLGDEQDAAGVAYRLLAAMVEPVMFDDEYFELPLTVGIAVADGSASVDRVMDASVDALASAMGRGSGGFSIVDIRPGLAA